MNSLANIKTITKRELGAYFSSPLAYVFLVIFLLLCGFFTFFVGTGIGTYFRNDDASLVTFFIWHPWFYLFLVPAVGMRLWAEERRVGTLELLMTMPITPWQAIVGKFLASWLFLGLALLLTIPLWITTNYLGSPDNGVIFAAYVGSWLMAGSYLAISCIMSAMTRSQVVSFILALVACLFLILCGYPPVVDFLAQVAKPWVVNAAAALSVMTHFEGFQKGVLDSRDVIFFLSIIGFSLFTTSVILRSHRAG
ncbi:MAG TPA: ABC transporter permease [Candidatus Angelobacter sp.]|nr:ABC transporter permease [Candidatus Angelobacter sp.]